MQISRFPVISGFRVVWDSRKPPGKRIEEISLRCEQSHPHVEDETSHPPPTITYEPIKRENDGKKYKVVTREYMAQGHDGFIALKGHRYIVDDENGKMMSTIVRQYLLGMYNSLFL